MFFYLKKDLKAPAVEPVGMKSYMLVRTGLNVREEEWFGEALGPDGTQDPEAGGSREACETGNSGRVPWIKKAWLRRRNARREEKERRAAERERERRLAEREERICRAEEQIRELALQISGLADEPGKCRCVYEDSIRRAVAGKNRGGTLPRLWNKYLEWEEFDGYQQQFWVERLISRAEQTDFVILGTAPCIYGLIEKYASRMKSLRWILPKAGCSDEVLDFVEDFYTEYGLAVSLETLESNTGWKRFGLFGSRPSCIIDFAEEVPGDFSGVARGSVWVDVFSREEKKYRIQARRPDIRYISMKEEWKRVQRRCRAPETVFWMASPLAALPENPPDNLDTGCKSGYNTEESEG